MNKELFPIQLFIIIYSVHEDGPRAIVDNHFGTTPLPAPRPTPPAATAGKRPRAESTSSSAYDSGSDVGRPIPALSSFRPTRFKAPVSRQPDLPGFSRGGSRGACNDAACGSKRGLRGGRGGRGGRFSN